jgi:hypothetical protein
VTKVQDESDRERNRQDLAIPLEAMEGKEKSGEGLKSMSFRLLPVLRWKLTHTRAERIAARQNTLINAMVDILDASTRPPMNQRDTMSIMSRQLRTQFNTQQIIRSCEDLLTLIRWMQEQWLFGNLDTLGKSGVELETEKDVQEIVEMLKRLDKMQNLEANGNGEA